MLKVCHVCGQEFEAGRATRAMTCHNCLDAGFKWCNDCERALPLSAFSRNGDGFASVCKICQNKRTRALYGKPMEKLPDGYKRCSMCGEVKPISAFYLTYGKPQARCKTCHTAASAACYKRTGYMKRPEVIQRRKEAKQKYYGTTEGHGKINRLVRERQRRLYNSEETYREKKIAQCHARRAVFGSYTAEDFEAIKEFFDYSCAYCGKQVGLTVDHVVPLASGGSNSIENIVPACLSCNCSKGAREMLSWCTKRSFFSPERLSKIRYYMEVVMT